MIIKEELHGERVVLFPGDYYVTDKRLRISTLLGSCVSVCLYDPVNRVAGMNHFLLGNKSSSDAVPVVSRAGRYGEKAMELTITDMLKLGARREYLKAKVCGGSSLFTPARGKNGHCVGKANCAFAQEFLNNDGISIVSSDLGGTQGRVVHFDTHDYSLYVKKIRKISFLFPGGGRDKEYWKRELKRHVEEGTAPVIWR